MLFSAASAAVKRFWLSRRFVTIENIKPDIKKLKALNPEAVVHGAHGRPTTCAILDETDKFYEAVLWSASANNRAGQTSRKSKRSGLPEYKSWSAAKERLDTNVRRPLVDAALKISRVLPYQDSIRNQGRLIPR